MKRNRPRKVTQTSLRDDLINICLATAAALFLLVFVSKAHAAGSPSSDPVKVCGSSKLRNPKWNSAWTDILKTELKENRVSEIDLLRTEMLCTNYRRLDKTDREKVWTVIMTQLAEFESSYDPNVKYVENFRNSAGERVVSRGLYQISKESSDLYDCGFDNACQIHDPKKNIACAVKILVSNMKRQGIAFGMCPRNSQSRFCGASAYWGPFRNMKKLIAFQAVVSKKLQPLCGANHASRLAGVVPGQSQRRSSNAQPANPFAWMTENTGGN